MSSAFVRQLKALNAKSREPSGFVYVPYDQLTSALGPLSRDADLGIVVVESAEKATRRPYHKHKLALVLTSLRHFALEEAAAGRRVVHLVAPPGEDSTAAALRAFASARGSLGPLVCQEPAERELRQELAPLVEEGLLTMVPHEGWLTSAADFTHAGPAEGPWRMDAFYRQVRRRSGVLMDERNKPVGGRFSFDGENREPWKGTPVAPTPPVFEPDDITREVCVMVEARFADHPGAIDARALPATRDDVEALWAWAKAACLAHFGPYEDAMSTRSRGLFHTRISALVNLHRLTPRRILDDVLRMPGLPLASREAFVRQLFGWREFVRHVHLATDGFRRGPHGTPDGAPSFLGAREPLPAAFWPSSSGGAWGGAPSGLACLDRVVDDVWREAYSHHITRLMVLGNIATLLDVSPRALTDWFWVAYQDAFDWVVEPNVLGMATFAAGDTMTTKPYVAGSAYVDRMSDFCGGCAFKPGKAVGEGGCPLTALYWDFLARHADRLRDNERMKLPLASCRKRSDAQRQEASAVVTITRRTLAARAPLTPAVFESLAPVSPRGPASPKAPARARRAGPPR